MQALVRRHFLHQTAPLQTHFALLQLDYLLHHHFRQHLGAVWEVHVQRRKQSLKSGDQELGHQRFRYGDLFVDNSRSGLEISERLQPICPRMDIVLGLHRHRDDWNVVQRSIHAPPPVHVHRQILAHRRALWKVPRLDPEEDHLDFDRDLARRCLHHRSAR